MGSLGAGLFPAGIGGVRTLFVGVFAFCVCLYLRHAGWRRVVGMTVVNTKGVNSTVTHNLTRKCLVRKRRVIISGPDGRGLRGLGTSFPGVGAAGSGVSTTTGTSVMVITMGP